jgi:drug/metabolite transporter (DMT)-like permease
MRYEYLCIAIVALMWGCYPLVARASGVGGALGALVLTVAALAPIVGAVMWQGGIVKLASVEILKLGIAGVMMGVGLIAFNAVANSRNLDASVSIPIIDTTMLIVTVIGAIVFFAEPITARKLIGVALLVAGIMVLKPA